MLVFHQDRDLDEQHHDGAVLCGCIMEWGKTCGGEWLHWCHSPMKVVVYYYVLFYILLCSILQTKTRHTM